MSAFMGKPDAPKSEPRKQRKYVVELANRTPAIVHANYMRSDDGLVSFWQDVDNEPDTLEVMYPIHRIQSITEEVE